MRSRHSKMERHYITRIGWLRAAVLGANDGIISTASLISGVAASGAEKPAVLLTGVAALVAGALSMAAGEYVSVSSQADTESADLERERQELKEFPDAEHEELKQIYVARGLSDDLAGKVATQLMATDALAAHARDELGMSEHTEARPIQAAVASALTFASGAVLPLIVVVVTPAPAVVWAVMVASVLFLAGLGALGARTGGSPILRAVVRVTFWGVVAMGVTAGIGRLFHTAV